ncbi:conjugal transfer protein TraC [Pannonibacter phragmitetus]|uniref:conjugal transfer protein TraC n=1 Tax=Pannonibacter phragmitetus TaxID=121719 RepID=UPI000E673F3C|nr:conjugal transfer protein TraC [Pannonibacter phragmitetus]
MKKPSSKIREEIARLQEQLKRAETREAERIGRLALKAGLGDIEIEERALVTAFEELTVRFRKGSGRPTRPASAPGAPGAAQGPSGEA